MTIRKATLTDAAEVAKLSCLLWPDNTLVEMVEEFETAVSKLKVDKVSDIVETDYGYHIIKRIELPEFDYEMFESLQYNMALDSVAEHYSKIADNATIDTSAYTLEELIMLCR